MMTLRRVCILFMVAWWAVAAPACRRDFDSFAGGTVGRSSELDDLLGLVEKYKTPDRSKERFIVNKQIIELYNTSGREREKILERPVQWILPGGRRADLREARRPPFRRALLRKGARRLRGPFLRGRIRP
jgi:hypothetical protein